MAGKWLELLKEIAPRVNRVAFLFNPATAPYAEYYLNPFKAAAASFAVEAIAAPVRDTSELESVIAAQAREPNGGLIVMPDTFMTAHRAEITSLAARYRLPAVYPFRFFTEVGGLLSYGNDLLDNFRRAATYADRILKGAKPSELPVQAPVKFELVINLKTAKALGLDVPLHAPAARRRGDRIDDAVCCGAHMSPFGTFRRSPACAPNGRYQGGTRMGRDRRDCTPCGHSNQLNQSSPPAHMKASRIKAPTDSGRSSPGRSGSIA